MTGGMTFAGGPFNHFVVQSLVALGPAAACGLAQASPASASAS